MASIGSRLINARPEGIETKAPFRAAFKDRRCLIPTDCFYEWLPTAQGKQPYRIMLARGELFAFAGLWEGWKDPQGEAVESCCIVTCATNELAARFHDRMPVIIAPEDYHTWLTGMPSRRLRCSRRIAGGHAGLFGERQVNSQKNDSRELVDPGHE